MSGCSTFIHVGQIYVDVAPCAMSTVLGSCVAVCLYDTKLGIGGMNHYLLPLWDGNGLRSSKFGNISIPKLIETMQEEGSCLKTIKAKIFGGASINIFGSDDMMIGKKNILIAKEILKEYKIAVVAEDIGGEYGRKIKFNLECGRVLLQYTLHDGGS